MGLLNVVVPKAEGSSIVSREVQTNKFVFALQLERLEMKTLKWCREILRNGPTAILVLKSTLNAVDDGHAGLQCSSQNRKMLEQSQDMALVARAMQHSFLMARRRQNEGKTAYMERRSPDYTKFPRRP